MLTWEQIAYSLLLAALAWVFIFVLTDNGMILGRFAEWIDESSVPAWIKKIFTCVYCFAGQLALWFYLAAYLGSYDPLQHVFFISTTIFISATYTKLL